MQETADCAWFSFHVTERLCKLMGNCTLDETKEYFVSGMAECSLDRAGENVRIS